MSSRTKLGIFTLLIFTAIIIVPKVMKERTYYFGDLKSPHLLILKADNEKVSSELETKILEKLEGKEGSFGVYVESLATNSASLEKINTQINISESMPSASLYKLILIAAVLKEVELGSLTLETRVGGQKADLTQKLGSVDYGYEDAPEVIGYSVSEAITRIATISDNFASIILTDKIWQLKGLKRGERPLGEMALELNMNQTDFEGELITTTPADIAIFFKQLYEGKVVSRQASDQIIDLLSKSKLNTRIPAKLPEGVKIAHKTGELPRIRHDAGLVFLEPSSGGPYLIVMMSKGLKDENEAIETMAEISLEVYNFINSSETQ